MTEPTINTPQKTFTLTINGMPRDITMSYGLLNELLANVTDLHTVSNIFNDSDTRNKALISLLSERTNTGKIVNTIRPDDVEVDLDEISDLLTWGAEHVTGFFIRTLTNMTKQIQKMPRFELPEALSQAPESN